jgi:photosystem II stability/assembly factor-like uncharacterized protein
MIRTLFIALLLFHVPTACSSKKPEISNNYSAEVLTADWLTGEFLSKPGLFILAGRQGSIIYSLDGYQWNHSRTPSTNALHDIEANHSQTVLIAVGENGTILRSVDHGKTWQQTVISLPTEVDVSVTRLNTVVYSHKENVWLAAGTQNTILRSSDDGLTWKLVSFNTRVDQLEILNLFIEKQSGDVLFSAQHATIGHSRNGGESWEIKKHDLKASGSYIPHIVDFHQYNNTLIATADSGRLLISKNAGLSWKIVTVPTAGYFTDSAYDSKNNTIALTTQMGEIAISRDEGNTWNLTSFNVTNWPSRDIPLLSNIIYDENSQSFLAVGNSGVIARSNDGGESWFADIYKPLFNLSVTSLLHDTKYNKFVIAGFGGSIAISKPLGATKRPLDNWTTIRPGIDQYIRKVLHLPHSSTFIAVGQLGSVWRSEDDGKSWKFIDIDYPLQNQPPHLRDIVQDPVTQALIAAGPAGSIIHSSDNGLSWKSVYQGELQKGEAFTQLLYDKEHKRYYTIEVLYRSVYQSSDNGLNWSKIANIESGGRNLWHGVYSKELDLIMVIGEKGGIALSRDAGYTWKMATTHVSADLYGAYIDPNEGVLLAVGESGVILRSENGTEWQTVKSGTTSSLRRVIKDHDSNTLIAFGQNGTIIRSTDGGKIWLSAKTPEYAGELRTAFIDYRSNNLIVVGREGGILCSSNSGVSWSLIKSHTRQHFRSATINPKTGTIISAGEGIVRLTHNANL